MDGEVLLPTKREKVFMVENHRLAPAVFRQGFETLKQLVAARDRNKTVIRKIASLAQGGTYRPRQVSIDQEAGHMPATLISSSVITSAA